MCEDKKKLIKFEDINNIDLSKFPKWNIQQVEELKDFIIKDSEHIEKVCDIINKTPREVAFLISDLVLNLKSSNFRVRFNLKCDICGKIVNRTVFRVKRSKNIYCSSECSTKSHMNGRYVKCMNCGKMVYKNPTNQAKSKNLFCSKKCADIYNSKQKITRVTLICKFCGKEYEVSKYKEFTSKYCSNECRHKYESKYNIGINNKRFSSEMVKCDYCGEYHLKSQCHLKEGKKNFCSNICRQKWFSEVYSQNEDYKEYRRKNAVKILEDGLIPQVNTSIQLKINKLLSDLNINYINEKGFKYYSIDNYLYEYNLCIEVMGTYWHTDHRKYKEINYSKQVDRIIKDKAKQSYITNHYNTHILYLWEYDIDNYYNECKKLILEFVKNKGILNKYHSFNYTNDINGVAYMNMEIKSVNKIVNTTVKKERCKKDESKWIKYKCDYCGKECEELISHYKKKDNHCCSRNCAYKLKTFNHSIRTKCSKCGRTIFIKEKQYKTYKKYVCKDNIFNKN